MKSFLIGLFGITLFPAIGLQLRTFRHRHCCLDAQAPGLVGICEPAEPITAPGATSPLSPTLTSSRSAPTSACVILGWRPRPARRSASPRLAGPDFMIEIEAVAIVIPEKRVRAVASAAARQA